MNSQTSKIILIDDNKMFRELLADTLDDFGFSVVTAENGLDGLHQLNKHQDADLVIVDLIMPIMNGFSFIQAAREKFPDIPIVVISGVGSLKDAIDAIRLGAMDFINKPIENLELLKIIIDRSIERCVVEKSNREYRDFLENLAKTRSTQLDEAIAREMTIEKESHYIISLYKNIFTSLSSPMLLVAEQERTVLDASSAFLRLSGLQPSEIIGKSFEVVGLALGDVPPTEASPQDFGQPGAPSTISGTWGGRAISVLRQPICCPQEDQGPFATLLFDASSLQS